MMNNYFFVQLYKGRIGRRDYFLGSLFFVLVPYLLLIISGAISLIIPLLGILIFCPSLLAVFNFSLALTVRRLHDLGEKNVGVQIILLFIPLVNIVVALRLLFVKGQPAANENGLPPQAKPFFSTIFNKQSAMNRRSF